MRYVQVAIGNVEAAVRLSDCHNFHDFRKLAERRLPRPVFDYIDGGADDETSYRHNTASFESLQQVS